MQYRRRSCCPYCCLRAERKNRPKLRRRSGPAKKQPKEKETKSPPVEEAVAPPSDEKKSDLVLDKADKGSPRDTNFGTKTKQEKPVVADSNRCGPRPKHEPTLDEKWIAKQTGDRRHLTPYSCRWYVGAEDVDIEHIVPWADAVRTGLSCDEAKTFVNYAPNTTVAFSYLNRHVKSDNSFAKWKPKRNKCWVARRVVDVKRRFGLAFGTKEKEDLDKVLGGCSEEQKTNWSCSEYAGGAKRFYGDFVQKVADFDIPPACGADEKCTEEEENHRRHAAVVQTKVWRRFGTGMVRSKINNCRNQARNAETPYKRYIGCLCQGVKHCPSS